MLIAVRVIEVSTVPRLDGRLRVITVVDPVTGRAGRAFLSDARFHDLFGDCSAEDMIELDPALITWKADRTVA